MNKYTIVYDRAGFGSDTRIVEAWDSVFAIGKAMTESPPDSTVFQVYCAERPGFATWNHNFDWELFEKKKWERQKDLEWVEEYEKRTGRKWAPEEASGPSEYEQSADPEKPLSREEALLILGLKDEYTNSDLKRAYSAAMKKNHPDKVADLAPEFQALANRNAKRINQARELLEK